MLKVLPEPFWSVGQHWSPFPRPNNSRSCRMVKPRGQCVTAWCACLLPSWWYQIILLQRHNLSNAAAGLNPRSPVASPMPLSLPVTTATRHDSSATMIREFTGTNSSYNLYVLIHVVEATFNNFSSTAKAPAYVTLWIALRYRTLNNLGGSTWGNGW